MVRGKGVGKGKLVWTDWPELTKEEVLRIGSSTVCRDIRTHNHNGREFDFYNHARMTGTMLTFPRFLLFLIDVNCENLQDAHKYWRNLDVICGAKPRQALKKRR